MNENNHNIDKEIEELKSTLAPISENIKPPFSVTPAKLEEKLEGVAQNRTIFTTPLFKKAARGILACAVSLTIVAGSVMTYQASQNKALIKEGDKNVSIAGDYKRLYQSIEKLKKTNTKKFEDARDVLIGSGDAYNESFQDQSVKPSTATTTTTTKTAGYGKTNTQVADVDEGDILKNDGKYLYFLSGTNNKNGITTTEAYVAPDLARYGYSVSSRSSKMLKIISAGETGKMQLLATVKFDGDFQPEEMYLSEDNVILVGQTVTQKKVKVETSTAKTDAPPSIEPATAKDLITYPAYTGSAVDPNSAVSNETGTNASSAADDGTTNVDKTSVSTGAASSSGAEPAISTKEVPPSRDTLTEKTTVPEQYYSVTETKTTVQVYDVSVKMNPRLLHTYSQDGGYLSSRMTGTKLYLVSNHYIGDVLNKITQRNIINYVPKTCLDKGRNTPIPAEDIAMVNNSTETNYAVISGIDTETMKTSKKAVLGSGDTIYATTDNLYVACYRYKQNPASSSQKSVSGSYTSVLRFSLPQEIKFTGSCDISGNILNKYSMDETDGLFRIATTTDVYGYTFSRFNNVFVLDQNLKITGSVENLAEGETIKSVRFMGKTAYVVTFRQTDPLFAIDLSVPSKPKVLGELKIPGFSEYLHPVDETHLLGVGVAGNEQGQTGGVKLSLFDVSNPKAPREAFQYNLPGSSSSSYIGTDPKSFLYDAERGIIGIPATINGLSDSKNYSTYVTNFNVLCFIQLNLKTGFTPLFDMANTAPVKDEQSTYYRLSNDTILRGTYIGDAVYSVSEGYIISASITEKKRLGVLSLGDETERVFTKGDGFTGQPIVSLDPKSWSVENDQVLYPYGYAK
ncbi:MAG: hypothetical protein BGN88_14170 [Clostridiales bacterium 43-6]|nr:MAG: hypothetical protein BGN88_14170 [Clostridiales bacterium 43-6]